MQDTFAKATRSLAGYRGGNPRSWLFAITKSVYIDDARRQRPEPTLTSSVKEMSQPDRDITEIDLINRALAALPERQRTALLLADEAELPYSEIASIVDATPAAVKVLIHRARTNFRNAYQRLDS